MRTNVSAKNIRQERVTLIKAVEMDCSSSIFGAIRRTG